MNSNRYLVLAVTLSVTSAIVGYWLGQSGIKNLSQTAQPVQQLLSNGSSLPASKLFQTQTATVLGKITAVSSNSITVMDEKNQTDQFILSQKWVVYKTSNNLQASPSSDLKSIEKEKLVMVTLELIDGSYQVVSIAYLPPTPTGPSPTPPTSR